MTAADAYHILLIQAHLTIPESHSLKEKRRILKSMRERIRGKWNVSVAEVGLQDKWQAAILGVTCISSDKKLLDACAEHVRSFIDTNYQVTIIDWHHEYL